MRNLLSLGAFLLAASVATAALAGEWTFNQLKLGTTTPDALRKLYPDSRTEIPKEPARLVMHFEDDNGATGVCHFMQERLHTYTVTLPADSRGVAESGGWHGMIDAGKKAFGEPTAAEADSVIWDLEKVSFSLSRGPSRSVTVSLSHKELEEFANSWVDPHALPPAVTQTVVFGGPYYLQGFRPGITRRVKLTRGVYSLETRHEGRENFAVYFYSADDHDLVANEIGHCRTCTTIHVDDLVQEAFFVVKYADGPWEINLKKLPGVNP